MEDTKKKFRIQNTKKSKSSKAKPETRGKRKEPKPIQ